MKTWHMVAALAAAAVLTLTIGLFPARAADADGCPQAAFGFTADERDRMHAAVTKARADAQAPGITAGVFVPGRGTWICVVGVSDQETSRAMNAADRFRVGSITKTFTGTAVLQLVERGLIGLDEPLSRYVDWPDGNAITIRQLLNMTAGVYNYTEDPEFIKRYQADPAGSFGPRDALDIARNHEPYFPPGQGFHYSDTNYILLETVVERVTGRSIGDWIAQEIVGKLGLDATNYPSTNALEPPFARGYDETPDPGDGATLRDVTESNPGYAGAAGAMVSNLRDLSVWAAELADGALISDRLQRERLRTVPLAEGADVSYGLGIADWGGWLGHNGTILGYNTAMFYLPDTKAVIVVEVNRSGLDTDHATPLFGALAKILYPDR
ncbi:serine hydrolase domain-containing protein [Catellatospora methionotrophica]|uniref:serine hydrolase domain-containing protein n=1 Tax=Catellatospora methionotrophica TaxID=121620 RepID=UPI0034003FFE